MSGPLQQNDRGSLDARMASSASTGCGVPGGVAHVHAIG
jgi:hypothetical protein